jgi:hypothetical protein
MLPSITFAPGGGGGDGEDELPEYDGGDPAAYLVQVGQEVVAGVAIVAAVAVRQSLMLEGGAARDLSCCQPALHTHTHMHAHTNINTHTLTFTHAGGRPTPCNRAQAIQ